LTATFGGRGLFFDLKMFLVPKNIMLIREIPYDFLLFSSLTNMQKSCAVLVPKTKGTLVRARKYIILLNVRTKK